MVQQLGAAYVSSIFATTLAVGVLIVVIVWRPQGLFGRGARRENNRIGGGHVVGLTTRFDPRVARVAAVLEGTRPLCVEVLQANGAAVASALAIDPRAGNERP